MPWVMLAPQLHSVGWVIFIFSLAFFGQQSWSTLVMILPTDMISKRAVGTLAGLVGFGGAMGGVLLGQVVGWLRDHGYSLHARARHLRFDARGRIHFDLSGHSRKFNRLDLLANP